MDGKLNALDLFSGIGGNSLALAPWVRTIAYCEREPYAQAVLLSRMSDGTLESAPIWDDVQTLRASALGGQRIDIIIGGFPCQDISVAGRGAGLEGKRSGLYWEIYRLAQEIQPPLLFLENVPAIRTRGLDTVVRSLSELGYDCRWMLVSAAEVGAHHLRERWFLLAYSHSFFLRQQSRRRSRTHGQEALQLGADGEAQSLANSNSTRKQQCSEGGDSSRLRVVHSSETMADSASVGRGQGRTGTEVWFGRTDSAGSSPEMANSDSKRLAKSGPSGIEELREEEGSGLDARPEYTGRWEPEPDVGRVVNGLPYRVDRIKCLGNAVVPAQAREAFLRLIGR